MAVGQVLTIVTLPLLSREFDPSTFGLYAVFVGMYAVISVVAGLRYDTAIVLPRNASVAIGLSALVCAMGLAAAAVLSLLALLIPTAFSSASASPAEVQQFGLALAAATALGSLQRVLASWCTRRQEFLRLGYGQFAFTAITVALQLSFGRGSPHLATLVWAHVAGLAVQVCCLWGAAAGWQEGSRDALLRSARIAARRYRRFPKYMVGYAFASSLRDRLVLVVIGAAAGSAVAGRFGLSWRLVSAPNSLVYSAISPVFYSHASRGDREEIAALAGNLIEVVFLALLFPYLVLSVEAPLAAEQFLGPKWSGTGLYLQALAAPALVLAATCWLDRAFDRYGKQKIALALETVFTVLCLLLLLSVAPNANPLTTTWIFALASTAYYVLYAYCSFRFCGLAIRHLRRVAYVVILAGVVAMATTFLALNLPSAPLRLTTYGILAFATALVWLTMMNGLGICRQLLGTRAPS